MNLEEHYTTLYNTSIEKIKNNTYDIDSLIESENDNRFGITLLLRPSEAAKTNIQQFLDELKRIDSDQYYYTNSDIHITVMSIISCYSGFQLNQINIQDYIEVIKQSLIESPNIQIHFKGLTASPSCIMLQGFMNNSALNDIRDNLRENFKHSTLEQSIDKRYTIQTAHATVVRFKNKLKQKDHFIKTIERFKDHDFGSFKVESLELVYNDWYQKEALVEKLFQFEL
ncbi:2'-5' RNA ligase family protein [Aestuariibaculum suncheonense]|uniref:Mutarotase n=1 Tax=Aestuariibaculum suncheonense TaxID=1028745 RepID=A0A8J6UBQ6_9FLAO|nr:mutarotase [Aestuariibaculum suncheonense]MBD0836488.1 mutarotase [Aestuariibaculum suncheonense]